MIQRALVCACGERMFNVRLARNEGVGLATCTRGAHPSLLFDSRDYWGDIIQDGRPPEVRCRCKGKAFALEATYELREDGVTVRGIELDLRCASCGAERQGMSVDVDYSPTDALLDRPLDPCPLPWVKAKRVEVTAYWRVQDAAMVAKHLIENEGAHAWFAGYRESPRRVSAEELPALLDASRVYDVYFLPDARELSLGEMREPWRQLPVIHFDSPTHMNLDGKVGLLFYLRWAVEVFVDGQPRPHDPALVDLGKRLERFLASRFVKKRGKHGYDSPEEIARLAF